MDAGSADANIGKALGMARGLSQPADVLVLPELWAGGDPADSPRALEAVKAICAELGTFAVAGALPWRSQDGVSLRAWIVNDAGAAFAWYDKTHIPSTGEAYKAGESPLIFDAGGISCGVAIGYDILFPEFTRSIALAGAGVIFVPARWPESRRDAWAPILRSAAATGQVYVAACGASGGLEKSFFGGSSLVSPS
ncbi:MAG: hypothetical protein LBQ19_05710, partial [Synergistaceae bacterium]|nr:hypothetical protein [Synergistaceae bacterium]